MGRNYGYSLYWKDIYLAINRNDLYDIREVFWSEDGKIGYGPFKSSNINYKTCLDLADDNFEILQRLKYACEDFSVPIWVKDPLCCTCTMEVELRYTVDMVRERLGLDEGQVRFIYAGLQLQGYRTLGSYGIMEYATICYTHALRGD